MTDFTKEPFKGNHRGFARQRIERLLDGSGIVFNGTNPWDIQVHNSAFYRRVLINGSLGFGESYMDNMKVLDIGCGGFGKFVAQQYGVEVVEITISQAQVDLATEYCRGLPVEIRLQDYREVGEKFDAIVSLGMFEHVGHKNYRTYMDVAKKCPKNNARFLLHTIGKNDSLLGVDPCNSQIHISQWRTPITTSDCGISRTIYGY